MAYNTIKLKKYLDIIEEYKAHEAITPGELLELNSDKEVLPHATAGGNVLAMFALEDELQGKDIDDDYVTGDQVQVWITVRGEEVYAILKDGENVSIGDFLESAGDGLLQKHTKDIVEGGSSAESLEDTTIYTNQIVAIALQALDLSTSSGEESSLGLGSSIETVGYNRRLKIKIK